MINQHWTKDDSGRLAATWVEVSAAKCQPMSLLLQAAEPPAARSHDRSHSGASRRLPGGAVMCLVAAFLGWFARETSLL
jgi:hypothetical protein